MFTQDQLVVYPTQGVGKIIRIDHQVVGGNDVGFYIVHIVNNNVTAMVPVTNAANVGMRELCSKPEAHIALESFKNHEGASGYTGQNWNRRHREYTERLKSASLADVGYVVKELLLISCDKDLSFGERRLLEQAMGLITSELAIVLEQDPAHIKNTIEGYFPGMAQKKEQ